MDDVTSAVLHPRARNWLTCLDEMIWWRYVYLATQQLEEMNDISEWEGLCEIIASRP